MGGACTADGSGIIYIETGPVGGAPRPVDASAGTVTGYDFAGSPRTDTYDCILNSGLAASAGGQNDFCHVQVQGCQATVKCYVVAEGNTTPFDTWTVNGCVNTTGDAG